MIPIVAALAAKGLTLIGDAVLAKGKEFVEDKLGVKIPEEISDEKALELKRLEIQQEQFLIETASRAADRELDEKQALLADVADARKMQSAALAQEDVFSKRLLYWFAAGIASFTAVYILSVTFGTIPEGNVRFADTVLGFLLGTCLATVINFFFGTSWSSRGKDSTIDTAVKKLSGGKNG